MCVQRMPVLARKRINHDSRYLPRNKRFPRYRRSKPSSLFLFAGHGTRLRYLGSPQKITVQQPFSAAWASSFHDYYVVDLWPFSFSFTSLIVNDNRLYISRQRLVRRCGIIVGHRSIPRVAFAGPCSLSHLLRLYCRERPDRSTPQPCRRLSRRRPARHHQRSLLPLQNVLPRAEAFFLFLVATCNAEKQCRCNQY